jgi:hypothetical protein
VTAQERVKCLACNGHGGDGGQADNGTWEWPCEVCDGKRTVTAQEQQDAAVQSMRDQGIADACAGRRAKFWINKLGHVLKSVPNCAKPVRIQSAQGEVYRSAFAYARAYEANYVADPDPFNDAGDELNDMGGGDRG